MELIGHDRKQAQGARDSRDRPLSLREQLAQKIIARRKAAGG